MAQKSLVYRTIVCVCVYAFIRGCRYVQGTEELSLQYSRNKDITKVDIFPDIVLRSN